MFKKVITTFKFYCSFKNEKKGKNGQKEVRKR